MDRKLQRELADHLRNKDRAALSLLRAQIKVARLARVDMLRAARTQCRVARSALVVDQRSEREQLRDMQRAARLAERSACSAGKAGAKQLGAELESKARRDVANERADQRLIRRAGKPVKVRATARERAAEDDDAVRSNLPAELVPVFDKVRKKIKGSARRSRTEAFLEWAEENPDEILAVQQGEADEYLAKLVREQREMGRTVRNARRYKQSPDELAKLLAGVPF